MSSDVLHVANGDSTAHALREANVPGRVVNWADALTDGPVPTLDAAELRGIRGRFWSDRGLASRNDAVSQHQQWDRDLESFSPQDEVVIWCEHDLYDQLLLLHHLHAFATGGRPRALSLVCIDRFPGISRFIGLGQLTPEQLASLLPSRRTITSRQLALGGEGWHAFVANDPGAIVRFSQTDLSSLPYVRAALAGLLEEFPSTRDGLPRTERRLLEILASGPRSFGTLFGEWQATEAVPCYGDSSIWWRLHDLAAGPRPFVAIGDGSAEPRTQATVAITDDGHHVLRGELDWLGIDPFDRWIGGVHLTNAHAWRWDAGRGSVVRQPG